MKLKSWLSPKVEKRDSQIHGTGIFALDDINPNEVISYKAGYIVDGHFLRDNADIIQGSELQLDDDLYMAPSTSEEREDILIGCNHSCSPNSYTKNVAHIAMNKILKGEEVTVEYAIQYSTPTQEFTCNCMSSSCRRVVRYTDWQIPNLQRKYKGYFADFIQKRIDSQNS